MLRVSCVTRRSGWLTLAAIFFALSSSLASAAAIDLSLNLIYTNPASSQSGGMWRLVGKSDGQGLAAVTARISGIATAQNAAPRGTVNGSDPAGFGIFANTTNSLGFNDITIAQAPIAPGNLGPGEVQSVFYGVGTIANGSPGTIGPAIPSLTNANGIPWAAALAPMDPFNHFNDPAWVTAATLAAGTFAPGATPSFFANDEYKSRGDTFTTLGTSTTFGNISEPSIIATTIVRTNLTPSADYNRNGVVDAADYVLWRDTLGSTTVLDADGNNNNVIDAGDYNVWRANFGAVIGAGSGAAVGLSSGATVPEPATNLLFVLGAILTVGRARRGSRTASENLPAKNLLAASPMLAV